MNYSIYFLTVFFLFCGNSQSLAQRHSEVFALYRAEPCANQRRYDIEIKSEHLYLCIVGDKLLGIEDVDTAYVGPDNYLGGYFLNLPLNTHGKEVLSKVTNRFLKHRLAVILNGAIYSAPRVDQPINSGLLAIHFPDDSTASSAASSINASK